MRGARSIISIVVVVWLVIGAVAALQRGYFSDDRDVSCRTVGTTLVTIVAGPLNYLGANPKIDCEAPEVPEPSE